MDVFSLSDTDFRIYQPLFKNHVIGFEQKMLFSPVQMRCYHFFMPENYLVKSEFTCIPDGCVDIAFIYNDLDYWVELIGSPTKRKTLKCYPGYSYFGVRLVPGLCLHLDDFSLAEITDSEIIFSSKDYNIDSFIEKLRESNTLNQEITLFLEMFAGSITNMFINPAVHNIIRNINESKGGTTVTNLGKELGYSERQVCRLLDSSINLSPKMLCRIVRVQHAIHNIINNPYLNNVQYIADLSYSDQAHFQREFKEFTGCSPQEFKRGYQRMPGHAMAAIQRDR
ncbi:MAG: helix-turn-helix domain-containing protein [Lachnospiraceae bacterium]